MSRVKRVVVLLVAMNVILVDAAENKSSAQKVENQRKFIPQRELLIYPEDALIVVDEKKLSQGVVNLRNNSFIVPLGMDATLIDKNLVPKRIPDAPIRMSEIFITK